MPKHPPIPDSPEGDPARDDVSGAAVETVAPKRRRRFSASEKLRIVKAADAALASGERGAVAALLRKEGIYSSHLSSWRQQLAVHGSEGLEAKKPGRKPKRDAKDRELAALKKKNAELERKLRVANSLIDLQKNGARDSGSGAPRERREELMDLVEARDPEVPVTAACDALGVSRASLYRRRQPPEPKAPPAPRPPSSRRLSDGERQALLNVLHSAEFAAPQRRRAPGPSQRAALRRVHRPAAP